MLLKCPFPLRSFHGSHESSRHGTDANPFARRSMDAAQQWRSRISMRKPYKSFTSKIHAQNNGVPARVSEADENYPDKAFFERYRKNVGVCVVNSQGLVFVAQRNSTAKDTWQMPQGGIRRGETAEETAVRELAEETSMRSVRVLAALSRWLKYDFSAEVRERLGDNWREYDGQAQKWLLLHFFGDESEIDVDTEDPEFKDWKWMPFEELTRNAPSVKKEVYAEVVAEFAPIVEAQLQAGALSDCSCAHVGEGGQGT